MKNKKLHSKTPSRSTPLRNAESVLSAVLTLALAIWGLMRVIGLTAVRIKVPTDVLVSTLVLSIAVVERLVIQGFFDRLLHRLF